jgi:hypothetical protein
VTLKCINIPIDPTKAVTSIASLNPEEQSVLIYLFLACASIFLNENQSYSFIFNIKTFNAVYSALLQSKNHLGVI